MSFGSTCGSPTSTACFGLPDRNRSLWREVLERLDQLDPLKETIVVCFSGGAERGSHLRVETAGFNQVYNLTGGMVAWIKTDSRGAGLRAGGKALSKAHARARPKRGRLPR